MGTKQKILNRMPPYLPIIVEDWLSDADIRIMNDTQIGIFTRALIRQWQVGDLPRNVTAFMRECGITSKRDTVLRFLETFPHLFVCSGCGEGWARVECGCGEGAVRVSNGRTASLPVVNRKLKNLRIDVNFDIPLGTTELNGRESNGTKPNVPTNGAGSHHTPSPVTAPIIRSPIQEPKVEEPRVLETVPVDDSDTPETVEVPDADTSQPDEAIKLAHDFWRWLGKPARYKNASTFKAWTELIQSKMVGSSLEHVRSVLHYAAEESETFPAALAGVKRCDPMEYVVEVWENILSAREYDHNMAQRRNKKRGKERAIVLIEEKNKPMEL
jgi:hypothetical protein